jgi:acyl-CoA thioesterase FadM
MYQINRLENAGPIRLAEAFTDWVFVDFSRMVPRRIPQEVCASFPVLGDDPEGSARES